MIDEAAIAAPAARAAADNLVVKAEQFATHGGWQIDTQFIETMGSPYLIAHGLGKPVADASTEVEIAEAGDYKVWVRTIDWSESIGRTGGAGRFTLSVGGQQVGGELGKGEGKWHWEEAGTATLPAGRTTLALKDLSGFNGRVDAIFLSRGEDAAPPGKCLLEDRIGWKIPGAPGAIEDAGNLDLVVIGGGYGGLGAAISAARMGCKVALIQNRELLGGNGSSEIRVWAKGNLPPSEFLMADIIREIEDQAKASPASAEQFVDDKKAQVVAAEKNITLFLGHHAYGLEMRGKEIAAAKLLEVKSGKLKKVSGTLFADCTGHGFIGQWAGADLTMTEKGRMGMSNMWMWKSEDEPQPFRAEPWMLTLDEKGFPYPKRGHAEWFWESGYDSHPIRELEQTRDWNLLASFSAWNAIKNHSAYTAHDPQQKGHSNARLEWMAYIGGTREALGTIRVMKTIGMMGVAVGRAAAICKARDCLPRDVYEKHLEKVKQLWRMPGAKRFTAIEELLQSLDTAAKQALRPGAHGPPVAAGLASANPNPASRRGCPKAAPPPRPVESPLTLPGG